MRLSTPGLHTPDIVKFLDRLEAPCQIVLHYPPADKTDELRPFPSTCFHRNACVRLNLTKVGFIDDIEQRQQLS